MISTFATHESQLQNLCLTNPAQALELCQQLQANADDHSKALLRVYRTISQKMLEQNLPINSEPANSEPANQELVNAERQQLEQIKLENTRLHHELQAKTEQLETLAMHDQQTGLFNRRYIETHLDREYARARRLEKNLCVALINIDHFKTINDTHPSKTGSSNTGDEVLRTIAALFQNHARASDQIARFNNDEFILVIPDATLELTQIASERLRVAIEAFDWTNIHPELKVTVSIGLSDDAFTSHPDEMLKQADARLQQAKRAGCNRVCSILDLQR